MNKALLLALALIVVGCAEPTPRNLDELSRQGPQYLDPETLEPYSGPAYQMAQYDSTEIVLRVNLRDGRFHGDFEDFDPEGVEEGLVIYQTGTYRNGLREGPHEYFYPSGVFRGRGTYKNGLQEGPYESYYENGELRSRTDWMADELDGPSEFYYESGELRNRTNYVAGQRHGPYEFYHENGQLSFEVTYKDGEPHGSGEAYSEGGQLLYKGASNMGAKCGEWFENGKTLTFDPCPPDLED